MPAIDLRLSNNSGYYLLIAVKQVYLFTLLNSVTGWKSHVYDRSPVVCLKQIIDTPQSYSRTVWRTASTPKRRYQESRSRVLLPVPGVEWVV